MLIFRHPPLSSSPQLGMNECTPGVQWGGVGGDNGWGQLGTLSAEHHRDLCLLEKPNMHIPLCGSQKLSNQCCCMRVSRINSQLCCGACNGCELESAIANACRGTPGWVRGGGSQIVSQIPKAHKYKTVAQFVSLALFLTHTYPHMHTTYQRPQFWPTQTEYEPDALTNLWFITEGRLVYKVCDGRFMHSVFNWVFYVLHKNPAWAMHVSLHVEGVLTYQSRSVITVWRKHIHSNGSQLEDYLKGHDYTNSWGSNKKIYTPITTAQLSIETQNNRCWVLSP